MANESQDLKFRVGFIKISNGEAIPEDEPVFVLRARDMFALSALEYYTGVCRGAGCTAYQLDGMARQIRRFKEFAAQHPERIKEPGITEGA